MALTPKRLFLSLSAFLSLFSALTLFSHAHLWSLKLSLKMRVSSKELFSTLKNVVCLLIVYWPTYREPGIFGNSTAKKSECELCGSSVFPTEGFLRPGTQVRQFGRKLKALDPFFVLKFDAKL